MTDHEHAVAVPETPGTIGLKQWLTGKTATQLGGLLAIFIIWEIENLLDLIIDQSYTDPSYLFSPLVYDNIFMWGGDF